MKTRRVLLLMVVLSTVYVQLQAQTYIGRQKVDQFTTSATGNLTYGLTWLPTDYNSTTTKYPLIIFLHGSGENGTTINDLNKLISTALPQRIAQGWDPEAVNPLTNQLHKFIVVSPQAPVWSYGFPQIQHILNDVVSRYRVDTTRIYFTGLSAGGAGTNASVTNGPALAMRVSAIVPVAAAGTNTPAEGAVIPLIGGTYGVKVWNVCGTQDQFWNLTLAITDSINNATPPPAVPAIVTGLNNIGHTSTAWNTAYNPNWRSNAQNLNIYEWMLKYSRSSTSANLPPVVNAGADQTVFLPNGTTLNGSATDADGSIVSHQWTKISGPAQGTIATPNQPQTALNNMAVGTYIFRLSAVDNFGAAGYDEVTVTVQPSPTYTNIPAKIEAENWNAMSGVQTENTTDAGGGLNVGWIDNGDWMDYNVNSASATTYTLKLRIATPFSGAQIQVRRSNGTVLATVNLPNTTGFQAWQTVTTSVTLPAGQQTLRLISTGSAGWNINWLDFSLPVLPPPTATPTANSFSSYLPYTGKYSYGMNPGYYGPNWSAQNMANLSMGNPAINVKGVGAKSLRVPIYDDFITNWGLTSLLSDYQFYTNLGANEITAFVGMPHPSHRETATYPGSPEQAKTFKNLYEPIWLDSAQTIVNPNNFYAKYLYDVVSTYGPYVKFWEIVNEPDFTYSNAGWYGDVTPPLAGSWFDHDPTPAELVNLRAPIEHYVRMLRISWEVVKKLQPNDYVCTGGIGYIGFLDAILRNTDNPVDGSVTSAYPLKGGAYFDVLSFHNYPMYNIREWNNNTGSVEHHRHSDAATNAFVNVKHRMDSIMKVHGYNSVQFPRKQFICTETGVSRIMNGPDWGSNEGQKNYMIKAHVASQKSNIGQTYWFQLGDMTNPNEQFDRMGLYYYFGNNMPHNATKTDQGIAMKTTSDLLFNARYDSARTTALNLPSSVNGGAFRRTDNSFVYVLWAKTSSDMSETAAANYSFPSGIITSGFVTKKLWNFSETNNAVSISTNNISLDGTPSFYEVTAGPPPPNQLPVVNAGSDITITLPTNSTSLNGSATDADGTIASYQWTKIAGPAQGTIGSLSSPQTTVTNLVQGVYRFELRATDNQGGIGRDTVQVTVNPAPNQPPVTNAGNDQTITLPANSVTLNGSASDVDGTISTYQWNKIAGPATYTIANASQPQTAVTNLVQGIYQFELVVTDNNNATGKDTVTITVNPSAPPPNQAPVVNAGQDQSITLPTSSVTLNGTATDADGSIVSYAWTKISGPSNYNIVSPSSPSTMINGLVQGVYQFELRATDNIGAIGKDTVVITVLPAMPPPNQAPIANAGPDVTITLPVNTATLSGTATDPDGSITNITWTKISGPAQYTIASPNQAQTAIGNLVQGVYQFELSVIDNQNATGKDTVVVTVNAAPPNNPPTANAGLDQNMTLPNNSTQLNGTGTDSDGWITSYQWRQITGPVQATIANATQAQTAITGLVQGIYKFELMVTDNRGATGRDTVQVNVNAASNLTPIVSAGQSQTITLPLNSVTLTASASDPDGTITSYRWRKVSGPASFTIVTGNSASTTVTNLVEGTYQFEITVTDNNGAFSTDVVNVQVLPDTRRRSVASLYPNPATNFIIVEVDAITQKDETNIVIFNTAGVKVHQETFSRQQQTATKRIDISKLQAGVYILQVNTDINTVQSFKFVKR